jgi:hypothetical protein
MSEMSFRFSLLTHLLSGYNQVPSEANADQLAEDLFRSNLPTEMKIRLRKYLYSGLTDMQFSDFASLVPNLLDCKTKLESAICRGKSIEQIHSNLQNLVFEKCDTASQVQVVMLIQPLLRSLVPNGELYTKLYSEWTKFAKRSLAG